MPALAFGRIKCGRVTGSQAFSNKTCRRQWWLDGGFDG
jgi:hypothetical protein